VNFSLTFFLYSSKTSTSKTMGIEASGSSSCTGFSLYGCLFGGAGDVQI
jgi:hypothetical protein